MTRDNSPANQIQAPELVGIWRLFNHQTTLSSLSPLEALQPTVQAPLPAAAPAEALSHAVLHAHQQRVNVLEAFEFALVDVVDVTLLVRRKLYWLVRKLGGEVGEVSVPF